MASLTVMAGIPHVQISTNGVAPIPDRVGFGAMFAGWSNGHLLAAGGTNFPGKKIWEGGKKVWYDTIYVYDPVTNRWSVADQKLPRPMGYGVSVSYKNEVICCGGSDEHGSRADVFTMKWVNGRVEFGHLPSLPEPCMTMSGAIVDGVLYLAGGEPSESSIKANHTFWALDLSQDPKNGKWQELEAWPGVERQLAIAASAGGRFYLMTGVQLKADDRGKADRVFPLLRDVYQFTPKRIDGRLSGSWKRMADMPRAAIAAPSEAPVLDNRWIIITGGGDDIESKMSFQNYTTLNTGVLMYDTHTDRWQVIDRLPPRVPTVTSPTVFDGRRWMVINGEVAPATRTNRILVIDSSGRNSTQRETGVHENGKR